MAQAQLEQALLAIHNPSTSKDVRSQAQAVCDQFRLQPDSVGVSLQLYEVYTTNSHQNAMVSDAMRHFLLDTLEKHVGAHWENLDVNRRDELKNASMKLLQAGTRGILDEAGFVKEKIVGIITSIAERDWPQRWPTFLESIMNVAQSGSTQVELVLKVFLVLAEDCYNSEFNSSLHSSRRTDILQEFHKVLASVFPWFHQLLERAYKTLRTCNNNNSNDQTKQSEIQREWCVAASTMKTVLAFLGWVPLKFLINNNFLGVLCELLQTPDSAYGNNINRGGDSLQCLAASCVLALTMRKKQEVEKTFGTTVLFAQILTVFEHLPVLPSPLPLIPCPAMNNNNEPISQVQRLIWSYWPIHHTVEHASNLLDSQELIDKLALIVAALGSTHYIGLVKGTNSGSEGSKLQNEQLASKFIDILLVMSGHPGTVIPTSMFNVWASVIKTKPWPSSLESRFPVLLRLIADRMIKFGQPSVEGNGEYEHPSFMFTTQDLDDDEMFESAFGSLVGSGSIVLRLLSKVAPKHVAELMRARVQICTTPGVTPPPANLFPPNTTSVFNKDMDHAHLLLNKAHLPYSTCQSPVEMYFSATLVAMLESGMAKLPERVLDVVAGREATFHDSQHEFQNNEQLELEKVNTTEAAQHLVAMANSLVQFTTSDPLLLTRQLQAFSRLQRLFCCGTQGIQLFGMVFEKLFNAVTFATPQETNGLRPNTLGARKRACASMVEIFKYQSSVDKEKHPEIHHLLVSELPSLCQRVLEVIRQGDSGGRGVRPNEKVLLYEMLVVVSNALGDIQKQVAFLDDVVSESLTLVTAPETTNVMVDITKFYEFMGLGTITSIQQHSTSLQQNPVTATTPASTQSDQFTNDALLPVEPALNLKHAVAALLSLARSSKVKGADGHSIFPFARHWSAVVPVMLQITQAVHRCWYPEIREKLVTSSNGADIGLIAIHPEELRVLLGRAEFDEIYPEYSSTKAQCSCAPNHCSIVSCALWMSSMRDLMYSLFAAASWQSKFNTGLFQIPNIKEALEATVFHRLESLEHRHIRKLVSNLCIPLAEGCPNEYRVPVLFPCLQYVTNSCMERLKQEWPCLKQLGDKVAATVSSTMGQTTTRHPEWAPIAVPVPADVANGTPKDVQRFKEILQDVSIRHASRGVVDFLALLVSVKAIDTDSNKADEMPTTASAFQKIPLRTLQTLQYSPSDLCMSVLNHSPLSEPVLMGLVDCMNCPDAVTVQKAITALFQVLPTLIESDHAAVFAATVLFQRALEALLLPSTTLGGLAEGMLVSLVKDSFMMFVFGAGPLDVAQSVAGQDNIAPKSEKSKMYPSTKISLKLEELRPTRPELAQRLVETLSGLPGISLDRVRTLKDELLKVTSDKNQKSLVKTLLQDAALAIKQQSAQSPGTHALGEIFQGNNTATVGALPPKQVVSTGQPERPSSPVNLSGIFGE